MKNDPRIRNALDESLSSVHFDARDMHRVLRAVREQEAPVRKSSRRKRSPLRLDFLFAVATAALVIVPLSLFALRAQRAATSKITTVAAHGTQSAVSTEKPDGREDVLLATPLPLSTISRAKICVGRSVPVMFRPNTKPKPASSRSKKLFFSGCSRASAEKNSSSVVHFGLLPPAPLSRMLQGP